MARSIRCTLRLHHYVQQRNDRGEVYYECSRCGHMNLIMGPPDGNGIERRLG